MVGSNERIIAQIQSKQMKWKVLEDEDEDNNEDIDDGNFKIVEA